jgi:DNA-binding LacI/PurR family transcriptional regulator
MRRLRLTTKRVTIKDVALRAGVSPATVSNALNHRTDAMTENTLLRIRETIQSLGFRPSGVARALVTHHTLTIGVIISEIETPLFLQAVSLIEPVARSAGYYVLLYNARNLEEEQDALDLLLEKQVEGIIFLSISEHRDNEHLLRPQSMGVPLVLINRSFPEGSCDQITWNNAGGVLDAVNHLFVLGHRHIAFLRGPENRCSSEERLDGYRLGLESNGLPYCEEYVSSGDYTGSLEAWQYSTHELLSLSTPPTALIASDDIVAAVAMRTIQTAGLSVPGDVSVVGIDDQPFSTYLQPALTTVRLPVTGAGLQAIRILLDRIAEPVKPIQRIVLPCSLIVRESTAVVARAQSSVMNAAHQTEALPTSPEENAFVSNSSLYQSVPGEEVMN